ncbi:hypothetical protein [Streptomyces globisporus]|uniref:hypothetical protein n=1 Tax=Streptomyces globisporus TaxID=1908 RepID=UPI0004C91F6E|nr:hypothetical protein [Streptomyces globisporus]
MQQDDPCRDARQAGVSCTGAAQLTATMIMAVGAVWTHARPSPAMLAATKQLDFVTTLRETVATLTAGTLARASA